MLFYQSLQMEDVDENVEILNIDSKKAFANFSGRYLDSSASGILLCSKLINES